MNVEFYQRNLSLPAYIPQAIDLKVTKISKKAIGGCKNATITATGPREDLYDFLNWLRYGVLISSDQGVYLWWGYVARVEVFDRSIRATADIDTLSNRIAVAYTSVGLGDDTTGERATTAWTQDNTSVQAFGTKELLDGRGGTGQTHAEAARDRLLEQKKYPTAFFERNISEDEMHAEITCRGWWDTLEWKYASVPTRLALGFDTLGMVEQTIGEDHVDDNYNVVGLAQSFDTAGSFNLQQIGVYIKRVGTPPEDLTLGIYENPDDETPGAQLASMTIPPESVGETYSWIIGALSSGLIFDENTTYFLVISTTGVDQYNYYEVLLDGNQGYGAGVLRKKVGSDWSAGPAADMPFQLYANDLVETSQQIKSLITSYGQFMRSVWLDLASGIATESFRNGDSDAQYELEELLEMGTANNRRMFAEVDPDRNVRIYEQPASSLAGILLGNDGVFRNLSGQPIEPEICPVGVWIWPNKIVPSNVDTSLLLGLQAFLIEESEYDIENGELSFTPANIESPWDLGISDG